MSDLMVGVNEASEAVKQAENIALIYLRVSTKDQTTIQQKEEAERWAKEHGFTVMWVITDDGVSGSKRDRPGLNEALGILRSGKCKTIIVRQLSRLGRSFGHIHDLISEFNNKKIRFISINDNIDSKDDNPYTRAYLRLMSTFSELQREMIVENTVSKLESYKRSIEEKGYYITKSGEKKTSLGRNSGSKDKKVRRKSGYLLRYAGKKKGEQ